MKKYITLFFLFILSLKTYAAENRSLCYLEDRRALSDYTQVGRLQQSGHLSGCTLAMIGRTCAVSAGHCAPVLEEVHFNVPQTEFYFPLSSSNDSIYYVDRSSIEISDSGQGRDWAVFRLRPHHETKKLAGDIQGFFQVSAEMPLEGEDIVVIGHGYSRLQNATYSQQKSMGELIRFDRPRYLGIFFPKAISSFLHRADTTGGSSGSPVLQEGRVIGVHVEGGCTPLSSLSGNLATSIYGNRAFRRAINQCLDWEKEYL